MTLAGMFLVLGICLVLPWWVPAVPAALTSAYEAVVPPRAEPSPIPAPPTVPVAELVGDVFDAALVAPPPGPVSPYLSGQLAAAGPPLRVRVPRLRVDAPVLPISGQSGELIPPDDPTTLGWWREGRPAGAAAGAGIVTGHTVHTGGGALDELGTLRRDDTFTVVTTRGTITYEVLWQHDYPTRELAVQAHRLFSQDGVHRLLLITCSDWNGHGYDKSAVVFARPVAQT